MKRKLLFIMSIFSFFISCSTVSIDEDEYDVIITGLKPESSGIVYKVDTNVKLIVIITDNQIIPLLLNIEKKSIGIPDLPVYKLHSGKQKATINKDTLLGFPKLGELKMKLSIESNQIEIELKGFFISDFDLNGKKRTNPINELLKDKKIILKKR